MMETHEASLRAAALNRSLTPNRVPHLSGLPHQRDQALTVHRLLEEVIRAEFHRLRGRRDRALTAEEDHLWSVGSPPIASKDFKPVERRHAQVEDRDVEHILSQRPQCLSPVRDLCDVGGAQPASRRIASFNRSCSRVVVGEQDPDDAGFGGRHDLLST